MTGRVALRICVIIEDLLHTCNESKLREYLTSSWRMLSISRRVSLNAEAPDAHARHAGSVDRECSEARGVRLLLFGVVIQYSIPGRLSLMRRRGVDGSPKSCLCKRHTFRLKRNASAARVKRLSSTGPTTSPASVPHVHIKKFFGVAEMNYGGAVCQLAFAMLTTHRTCPGPLTYVFPSDHDQTMYSGPRF